MVYINNITNNEIQFILTIFKNPKTEYNSNNLSKILGISRMGCLKIAKKLENEKILILKILGKAKFFRLDLSKDYVRNYVSFLLKRETEQSKAYVKVWVNDLRNKISKANIAILFGSILTKGSEANDIDVLLVTNQKNFVNLKKEVEKINQISPKKLHPIYQSLQDLKDNIKKKDTVVLSIIKGVVVLGAEEFVELIKYDSN